MTRRALLGATVGPANSQLHGLDFVRVDGAKWSAIELDRIRGEHVAPALLDLPGHRTPRRHGTLTRSEFLVYAATEEWSWVNLRDVEQPDELRQARECLPEKVRLSATISSAEVLHHEIPRLREHADVLFVDERALRPQLEPLRLRDSLQLAFRQCARAGRPCLLLSELLPSMIHPEEPQLEEIGRLTQLLSEGCSGFVLTAETCQNPEAQSAVNILRLVTEHRRRRIRAGDPRAAARLGAGMRTLAVRLDVGEEGR